MLNSKQSAQGKEGIIQTGGMEKLNLHKKKKNKLIELSPIEGR